jgi:hypothetical protein
VVFPDDGNLQFLARAKVGEHPRLAHASHFRQRTNAQALQTDLRGQAQGRIDDGRLGLLPLEQATAIPARLTGGFPAAGHRQLAGRISDGHRGQTK